MQGSYVQGGAYGSPVYGGQAYGAQGFGGQVVRSQVVGAGQFGGVVGGQYGGLVGSQVLGGPQVVAGTPFGGYGSSYQTGLGKPMGTKQKEEKLLN